MRMAVKRQCSVTTIVDTPQRSKCHCSAYCKPGERRVSVFGVSSDIQQAVCLHVQLRNVHSVFVYFL